MDFLACELACYRHDKNKFGVALAWHEILASSSGMDSHACDCACPCTCANASDDTTRSLWNPEFKAWKWREGVSELQNSRLSWQDYNLAIEVILLWFFSEIEKKLEIAEQEGALTLRKTFPNSSWFKEHSQNIKLNEQFPFYQTTVVTQGLLPLDLCLVSFFLFCYSAVITQSGKEKKEKGKQNEGKMMVESLDREGVKGRKSIC